MHSWSERRQLLIEVVFGLVGLAVIAGVLIAVLYKTPSCTDNKQNQGEEGIDCGGPCPYLCTASVVQPIVRFATPFSPQAGRTDVIAYIDNPNSTGGAQHAHYTLELHAADGTLLAQKTGTVNLPPSSTAPLYIADVYEGSTPATQAFLTIDSSSLRWLKAYQKPLVLTPSSIQTINSSSNNPRVTATLQNPVAQTLYGQEVVATVFDANGNAIASSQTLVPELPSQGTADIVFTWNAPFSAAPVRVEILPAPGS